jgi:hypothetical protein
MKTPDTGDEEDMPSTIDTGTAQTMQGQHAVGAAVQHAVQEQVQIDGMESDVNASTAGDHRDSTTAADTASAQTMHSKHVANACWQLARHPGLQTADIQSRTGTDEDAQVHRHAPGIPDSLQRYDEWQEQAVAATVRPTVQPAGTVSGRNVQAQQQPQKAAAVPQTYNQAMKSIQAQFWQ